MLEFCIFCQKTNHGCVFVAMVETKQLLTAVYSLSFMHLTIESLNVPSVPLLMFLPTPNSMVIRPIYSIIRPVMKMQ